MRENNLQARQERMAQAAAYVVKLDVLGELERLEKDYRDRVPVLWAICRAAEEAEGLPGLTGKFDPWMVRKHFGGPIPGNLKFFADRRFIKVNEESRKRYYEMPLRRDVERGLRTLDL
jgi:hypothetical protein